MDAFTRQVTAALPAVRTDALTRAAYTSDASIYRVVPTAVLEPRDAEEVATAVQIAAEHGVGVTCRGGGTSIAGNAVGTGLIIDFSRHMNRVLSIDPDHATADVEPGVVLDGLRAQAARYGLTVGPDPSTHSRCTLGGMIGNHACGPHSVAWGTTADITERLDLLLTDGRRITAERGTSGDPMIDEQLRRLRDHHLTEIRTELGRFSRQVSGYSLDALLPEHGFHVARSLVGTEGTCGVLLGATVRLIPEPPVCVLLVLGFPDVYTAAAHAPMLAQTGALTVEGMDSALVDALRSRPGRASGIDLLPKGEAWLYCEIEGINEHEAAQWARALAQQVDATSLVVTDPKQTATLWNIRRNGAGIATRMADGREAWPGWEDSAVPPERLSDYLRDLHALMAERGRCGTITGHFGEGCLHLRVDWDLTTDRGIAEYRDFIHAAADLVVSHGGCASGEHGDGRARSELLTRTYSPRLLQAFAEFKRIWDPACLLNPGIVVNPVSLDADVRPGPGHDRLELPLVHGLSSDRGSIAGAVRRCIGVGSCRNTTGAMCPSFQVTGDEVHSTRGRARVLSEMLRGEVLPAAWRSDDVRDALDLCLSCKACRSECPVNVDMATYKAEFLYHHYRGRIRPRAHYTLGWLPLLARLASAAPALVNALAARPALARRLSALAGLEPRRKLIGVSEQTFRRWFRSRQPGGTDEAGTVVLWPDTFSNFLAPQGAQATVEVLEALGYRIVLPDGPVCCGLTWYSTGQLGVARQVLRRSVRSLAGHLQEGRLVVGVEPSCTQMLRADAAELLADEPGAQLLATRTTTLAELVAAHRGDWPFGRLDIAAVMQPHCHQQAGSGYDAELRVLARLGIGIDAVASGCCGMAGNFGYEPGHWDVSQAVAERELYPKVRATSSETAVLADGFSCRTQIAQGTPRQAEHFAEILLRALHKTEREGSDDKDGTCAS
ncbi:MAG: FAD-binding and (Fe-S)-binding domain-containing protein [Pseudonocardiaceae bacterium]